MPFYSPRSYGLAERTTETLESSLKFWEKNVGCSLGSYFDKVLFNPETLQTLEEVHLRIFCLDESYGTRSRDFLMLVWKSCVKATVSSRCLTHLFRKRCNTAWLHDIIWTIPASHEQIAPIPTKTEFKTEASPNDGNNVTEVRCLQTSLRPTISIQCPKNWTLPNPKPHKGRTTELEPNPNQRYPAWACGDVVAITNNRENL